MLVLRARQADFVSTTPNRRPAPHSLQRGAQEERASTWSHPRSGFAFNHPEAEIDLTEGGPLAAVNDSHCDFGSEPTHFVSIRRDRGQRGM
jgi:hypothetical protein